ncbi:MAG: FAD binding domain-containing protein, partial [Burkholderiales bacterium]|nr:FAD binding domain-containing protein [Burkholderiales bacterium]
VGGNIAGALPCSDLAPPLMALDARVRLASAAGERWVPLEAFFPEFGRSVASDEEVLAEIRVPAPANGSGGAYLKFHDRHSMDMTVVGVAARVVWDAARGVFASAHIALANAAPTVFRARGAETVLAGQPCSAAVLEAAAESACAEASPRGSWRAARAYREALIRNLTRRAIKRAWEKAAASTGALA